MDNNIFDIILQQLNDEENPTPPTDPAPSAKKKAGSKKRVGSILSDYAMAPPKRKSALGETDRVDIRDFGIHSVVEAKPDKSKLGAHSVGKGIEDIISAHKK